MRYKVNRSLIWDYDFTEADYDTEAFLRFYVVRLLTPLPVRFLADEDCDSPTGDGKGSNPPWRIHCS